MTIPGQWSALSADEKRARALEIADELFSRDGVDVAMPVLAEAIGVGVGSIYRQVGTKDDLIAALIVTRAETLRERFLATLEEPDPWAALVFATHATVDDCIGDALSQSAWDVAASAYEEVRKAREGATDALRQMVERARRAGALRDDASHEDLRLIFTSLRELAGIGPAAAHRLADLVLRGMHRE
ncbi:MAG TPA: TetR/AcrR family transcriptional regulator [Solirubrobacterales bacterium]|nr:TetR/AcrR family transcriptional regulator [Solirubrobacterales bacterium]